MRIFDVPLFDLSRIADNLGLRLEMSDVSNSRGHRATGRLLPPRGGGNPYPRISSSPFAGSRADGEPRRVNAVCWHGFRDYFRAVFNEYPAAKIVTGTATYTGARHFEETHRDTGHANIGSYAFPMAMADACACPECGDTSGIDARVQPLGPLSAEEARLLAGYWHGGQTSPLYALSSSGMTNPAACLAEIEKCQRIEADNPDSTPASRAKLVRLAEYVTDNAATLDPMTGRVNYDPARGA